MSLFVLIVNDRDSFDNAPEAPPEDFFFLTRRFKHAYYYQWIRPKLLNGLPCDSPLAVFFLVFMRPEFAKSIGEFSFGNGLEWNFYEREYEQTTTFKPRQITVIRVETKDDRVRVTTKFEKCLPKTWILF